MLRRIKICGIKNKPTLEVCISLNVGFIGFNFVPQSPRYIMSDDAGILGKNIPDSIAKVALIVNENDDVINDIIVKLSPDYLQLHGTETPERIQVLKQKFNIPIIKAIGVQSPEDVYNASIFIQYADMILFDAKPSQEDFLTGGLGKKFNWSLLENYQISNQPFMLAGGLNYTNLREAKRQTNATYFDICSGVEKNKGEKSIPLILELQSLEDIC